MSNKRINPTRKRLAYSGIAGRAGYAQHVSHSTGTTSFGTRSRDCSAIPRWVESDSREAPLSRVVWFLAAWVPCTAVALVVSFQAAMTAKLVSEMGPPTVASSLVDKPWTLVWLVVATILAMIVGLANWLLRDRPRLGAILGGGVSLLALGLMYVFFVSQPVASVVSGY